MPPCRPTSWPRATGADPPAHLSADFARETVICRVVAGETARIPHQASGRLGPVCYSPRLQNAGPEPGVNRDPPPASLPGGPAAELDELRSEVDRLRRLDERSSGLLHAVLDQSPHGIIICDADGRIVIQNPAARRIWAGSAPAATVADWTEYRAFHPDGRPYGPGDWQMARCLTERSVNAAEEFHIQRFDGTHATLLGSSAPILDPAGTLVGALAIFADISHLKSVEDKLRLRDEQLATILRSISEAVMSTDHLGRITFMNAVAGRLTGVPPEASVGRPFEEIFRLADDGRIRAGQGATSPRANPVHVVLESGAPVSLGHHALLREGDARALDIEDSAAPIRAADGRTVGAVLVFRDASNQRRIEERLRLLSDASVALLSASLAYRDRLASVARLAVPSFSDWAAVDMVAPSARLERLATAHVDPEKIALVHELASQYPEAPESTRGVWGVVQTGRTAFVPVITDELLTASARDDAHRGKLRALGLRSYICAPLKVGARTLGAMTFATAESGRTYDAEDVSLAEDLARRSALALDNSILFEAAEEARRAAQKAEHRFRQLSEAIPEIVWAVSDNGSHEFLSPRWYSYTGQPTGMPMRECWPNAVHPGDLARCFETWQRARESEQPWEMEYRLRRADGVYRWHVGRSVPNFEDGRVVAWYGAAADIEDQKLAIRSRDDLLATVSHDLRNPLNVFLMAATSLRRQAEAGATDPTRVLSHAKAVERAARRMDALIRDLMDITAIESGRLSMVCEAHRVGELVREATEGAAPLALERGLRLTFSSRLDPEVRVRCDRGRILQVLENLIGNAIKFTPPGGAIEVRTEGEPTGAPPGAGQALFSVIDDGPGVAPAQIPYVFDRFWQGTRGTPESAGLGLAICKGIVEGHGGRIWIEPEAAVGATLRFTLPLAPG